MRWSKGSVVRKLHLNVAVATCALAMPLAAGADVASVRSGGGTNAGGEYACARASATGPATPGLAPGRQSARPGALHGFDRAAASPTAIAHGAPTPAVGMLAAYAEEASKGITLDEAKAALHALSGEKVDAAIVAEINAALDAGGADRSNPVRAYARSDLRP